MRTFISVFLFASLAQAISLTDFHCKNERLKAGLSQISRELYHLRVERLDNKSFSAEKYPDWRGFSLVFNRGECHGTYCSLKGGKHLFSAWDKSNRFFELEAPVSVKLLYTYRFHFTSSFQFGEDKVDVNIQDEFAVPQCLDKL
jgi:hypothetical protein